MSKSQRLLCPLASSWAWLTGDLGGTKVREESEVGMLMAPAPFLQGAWAGHSPAYSQSFQVIFIQPPLPAHPGLLNGNSLRFWKPHCTPKWNLVPCGSTNSCQSKFGAGVFVCLFVQMKSRREKGF